MKSTGLFLEKSQLFAGMAVAICVAGKEEPEVDGKGEPLLVQALVSSFGPSLRLYPFPSGIKITPGGQNLQRELLPPAQTARGFTLGGVREDVRFMPAEVYSVANAPSGVEFVAFVEGRGLRYEGSRDRVYLKKTRDGRLISIHPYQYNWWQREYPLPENTRLVPLRGGMVLDGLMAEARK